MMQNLLSATSFIVRRLLTALVALIGVTLVVFLLTHSVGNPVYLILGQRGTAAQVARLSQQYGFDRPWLVQYVDYLSGLLHGNLGTDITTQQPVSTELADHFPATLELSLAAMLIGLVWTVPLGVYAAIRPRGLVARFSQYLVRLGVAMPSFWLGLLLAFLFFYVLNVLPAPTGELSLAITPPPKVTGMLVIDSLLAGDSAALASSLQHLVLPAVTLSFTACAPILTLTRSVMSRVLKSDYIRSAHATGLPRRSIYFRYALKNALLPVTTMSAMTFGYLLGGTVLVETVFSWPGIGLYAVQSMQQLDYAPVLGVVLLASVAYLAVYFLADLVGLAVDPRVRRAH